MGSNVLTTPINEGEVRIRVHVLSLYCQIENTAPDFLSLEEDTPYLIIDVADDEVAKFIDIQKRELVVNIDASTKEYYVLNLKEDIWFDVNMALVGAVWKSDFKFTIESKHPKYLKYTIEDLDHEVQWLQADPKTNEIKSVSDSRKKFKPQPVSGETLFSLEEISRASDMLGRAIKKIDLRTGSAFVRFNSEKGRLDPLIISIAEKLGYLVEVIDSEMARRLEIKGDRVSHKISLLRNY